MGMLLWNSTSLTALQGMQLTLTRLLWLHSLRMYGLLATYSSLATKIPYMQLLPLALQTELLKRNKWYTINLIRLSAMEKIKVFEAFAGYGGASFGLDNAGIEYTTIGYSEIHKDAIAMY